MYLNRLKIMGSLCVSLALMFGCDDGDTSAGGDTNADSGVVADSGASTDSGSADDSGAPTDSGSAGDGGSADDGGTLSDGSVVDVDAGMPDAAAPMAPLLDEALDCTPRPGTGVAPGEDLLKVTLGDAEAICNDGSPAVMYVRPAADEANQNNWVFHLQGGGGCGGQNCVERWCERNEKMTSTATPPGMRGKGIMARSAENSLGDANQVFLYYCSSDNWAGRATDAVIPAGDETPEFRLHFNGEAIHNAALDALEAGVTTDDGTTTMPRFEGDGYALWTGTSGGCLGVAHTADRFAVRAAARGFRPYSVCDANFGPTTAELPAGEALDAFTENNETRYEISDAYASMLMDESCVEQNADNPSLCIQAGYVLANHVVSAPLFVRMDFGDEAIGESYLAAGFQDESSARAYAERCCVRPQGKALKRQPGPSESMARLADNTLV